MSKEKTAQFPLDLLHRASMKREDFFVSGSNETAVNWIDCWPAWPSPTIIVVGPEGSGKTHLGKVWCNAADAVKIEKEEFGRGINKVNRIFIDDVDKVSKHSSDKALFHLFNTISEEGGFILFTATLPPASWVRRLPDLTSRLAASPNIYIDFPDEKLISAVMLKMFADQRVFVSPEVMGYLLPRMERSFAAARDLVVKLNQASLSTKRKVTIPLASEVLSEIQKKNSS